MDLNISPISLAKFFLVALLLRSADGSPQCTSSSAAPDLTVSYKASSEFSVSISSGTVEASCYYKFAVKKWNGNSVSVTPTACAQTTTGSFETPSGQSPLQYGTIFVFGVDVYSDSACSTAVPSLERTKSIVPPLCLGPNYVTTVLSAIKRPFGHVDAMIRNRPLQGKCHFYLTKWAGVGATDTAPSLECGTVSFSGSGFTYGTEYAVSMAAFASSAVVTADQPLCGTNPVAITPSQCADTPTITNSANGAVSLSFSSPQALGTKCEFYLSQWSGTDVSALGVTKSSDSCGPVTFTKMDSGRDFNFGNTFAFEFSQFPASAADTSSTNPLCSGAVSQTFSLPSCDGTGLTIIRTDPSGIAITIPGKLYGACRVTMVRYNSGAVSIPRVGACTDTFIFTSNGGSIPFNLNDVAEFKYEFFANGDITTVATCETALTHPTAFTFSGYTCNYALHLTDTVVGEYVFSKIAPVPQTGTCKLVAKNCGTDTGTYEIPFPSCSASVSVTYSTIRSLVNTFEPGRSCQFSWKYYDASNIGVCDTSATPINTPLVLHVSGTTWSASDDKLTVTIGSSLPASLSAYTNCLATLVSCDGIPVNPTLSGSFTNCQNNVFFSVDGSNIKTGSICIVEVNVKHPTGNLLGGTSGPITMSVASVPSWGSSQKPSVTLFGDSCMTVSWPVPANPNGAPVLCYEVQRKDGAGSFYVIETCDQNELSSDTSMVTCGFSQGVSYQFQVVAINRIGRSLTSQPTSVMLKWLQSAPLSAFITPDLTANSFGAGSFPQIVVQASNPSTESAFSGRLFVGTLVNRCKLDSTSTITTPLSSGETGYSAILPLPPNSPPFFTDTFTYVVGSQAQYSLQVTSPQPPAGAYSLIVYSLETGGLQGQYWANILFSGTPSNVVKDPVIMFSWGATPIISAPAMQAYDMVSIRWTGFIEASFSEIYTFGIESYDPVRLWIDDVIVINSWTDFPCGGYCSGQAPLYQSVPSDRRFSHIRMDYFHSSSIASYAGISLQWSSMSQPLEIIPVEALFKASVVSGAVKTITITPGNLSPSNCLASLPDSSVVVGEEYTITVTAKDSYGNTLSDFGSSFVATFTQNSVGTSFYSTPTSVPGIYSIDFHIDVAASYAVSIVDQISESSLPALGSLVVGTGTSYVVTAVAVKSGTPTAGVPIVVWLTVHDSSGNNVLCSAGTLPNIFITAEWTTPDAGESRLPVTDRPFRVEKYGTLFDDTPVACAGTNFQAILTFDLAGTYSVSTGVDGAGPAYVPSSPLVVVPNTNVAGINSVVISTPFPPSALVVGQESVFTIQLRDAYMNPITVTPAAAPVVVVTLQSNQPTGVACTAVSGSDLGTYTCAITPTVIGSSLAFSILINGQNAGYLYSNGEGVSRSVGPWMVPVLPGWADATKSTLTGVRSVYMVGLAAPITLYLKDSQGNPLSNIQSWPVITASLSSSGNPTENMDATSFIYLTADASVIIPILAAKAASGCTLTVKIDGNSVPIPNGIITVNVIAGMLSATVSNCLQPQVSIIAGASVSFTCTTKDSGANPVTWTNVLLSSTYKHKTDASVTAIAELGTGVSGEPTQWRTETSSIVTAGDYSVLVALAQPGGLMAQYYVDASFTTLTAKGGMPLSTMEDANQPLYYSEIDPYVNFNLPGPLEVDNVEIQSAIWSGYVLPPSTTTYTFAVKATGGVHVQIGSSFTDLLTASSVDTQINVDLTQAVYAWIKIKYVPGPLFQISLKWVFSGSTPSTSFVIPALNVFTLLSNKVDSLTVTPAAISTQSIAMFSPNPIVGEQDSVIIHPMDQYGNSIASPTCLDAGISPTCFFVVSIPVSDGSIISNNSATKSDGVIIVPIKFGTDGQISVQIDLITGTGTTAQLFGSPFTVNVAAAQQPSPR